MDRPDTNPPLRLFGAPVVVVDGRPWPVAGTRPFQLLVYLACQESWVARGQLAGLFWPERDEAAARGNLRNLLHQVQHLGWAPRIELQGESVRWATDSDLRRFEAAAARGDAESVVDLDPAALLRGMETAASEPFRDWLRYLRDRTATRWRDTVYAQLALLAPSPAEAAAFAARAGAVDALDEVVLAAYLKAQHALGRSAEAGRAYRNYAVRLLDELGVEPSVALRELAATSQPPARPATSAPVVPAAGVLVGRRAEIAQLKSLLSTAQCRVVTILGPGGVGKSALASYAAPQMAAAFPDGVCWIALEDARAAEEVGARIASALALELSGPRQPLAQVIDRMRDAQALLVFDNAEHLAGFDAVVAELITACPSIKCAITSRSRLSVPGEWLLPLDGLPAPDTEEDETEVLRAFDAVKLFEARAQAISRDFDPVGQAHAVAELARLVDGLPLALELAAARVRLLPVAEIAREIARGLDVVEPLPGQQRRDRSLRASFAHSWMLLAPAERSALAACTQFGGAFSHEAARAVAQVPTAVLASLADKSLLRAQGDGRFSLHPLVRQCAAEMLADPAPVRHRHCEYFARRLGAYADFKRVDQKRALNEMQLELPNAQAAWHYALEAADAASAATLASPLRHFFQARGRWKEGIDLLSRAFGVFDESRAEHARALAASANVVAALLFRRGSFAECDRLARRALRLARTLRDGAAIQAALNTLGLSLWQTGRFAESRQALVQALRRARAAGDPGGIAQCGKNLAIIEKVQGHYERALALYEASLAIERQGSDWAGLVATLNNLGNLHRVRRRFAAALPYFEEGLAVCRANGLAASECFFLVNLAFTFLEVGDLAQAAAYAQQAIDAALRHGERQIELMARLAVAKVALARGDPDRARTWVRDVLVAANAESHTGAQLPAIGVAAEMLAARGDRLRAAHLWYVVAGHPGSDRADLLEIRQHIAQLSLSADEDRAARAAAEATTLAHVAAEVALELEGEDRRPRLATRPAT